MVKHELDRIDQKIIAELTMNGRISNAELCQRVGLSQSPCWNRVRKLEEIGVITGYSAKIDQSALGRGQIMMVQVTLDRHVDDTMSGFEEAIKKIPEIIEACVVAGEYDFLLKVALEDTGQYENFLRKKLYKITGVSNVRSILMLRAIITQ